MHNMEAMKTGWEDRLTLQVNTAGTFHCFFLDESDFLPQSRNPQAIIDAVVHELSKPDGNDVFWATSVTEDPLTSPGHWTFIPE
jgi:hypothetical protein